MKRVLIVNCYFDDTHRPLRRPRKIPHAMGPVFLAGTLERRECDIRLFDEVTGGPLEDEALLAWPDLLVLTGLTNAFDRMLHLSAYARTKNPDVIVVAGGPAIRALPKLARHFFDYACQGDVEQLRDVVADALGPRFAAEVTVPRYDLAHWTGPFGYIETSRYCNFRCSFCALTGEGRRYQPYALDEIRRQVAAMGQKKFMVLLDNNFYGNDRLHFLARVQLLDGMRRSGHIGHWAALVTNDFFTIDNLRRVRDAGCVCLFSGVESFDAAWLRSRNKLQNTIWPQVELIRKCLEDGIVFTYGLILDPVTRPLSDLRRELEFITGTSEITLPAFLSLPIPLLGTPFFRECVAQRRFLPNTKLRDVDGTTLVLEPLDPLGDVVRFVRDLQRVSGYRRRIVRQAAGFVRRYSGTLTPLQLQVALANAALLCVPEMATASMHRARARARPRFRTHVTTTEPLDDVYLPAFRVASRYRHYFEPTMITDEAGELTDEIANASTLDPAVARASGSDRTAARDAAVTFPCYDADG